MENDTSEQVESILPFLLNIIETNLGVIYSISEVEVDYDKYTQDRIECVAECFKTIELAQKQLQKQLRK